MPRAGGCDSALDPFLDAREAHPQWLTSGDELLQARPARHRAEDGPRFDLWRIPGRKRLALDGADLALTIDVPAQRLRIALANDLTDGARYACTVPLGPGLRGRIDAFDIQARLIAGEVPRPAVSRPVSRAALLHLRALQALDASTAGASQREIAHALLGADAVAPRWHADGELRAQIRHLLRRAQAFVSGGYLALAGAHRDAARSSAATPGDEPGR